MKLLLTSGETGTSPIPEQKQKLSPFRIGVPSLQLCVFIPEQPSLGISQNGALTPNSPIKATSPCTTFCNGFGKPSGKSTVYFPSMQICTGSPTKNQDFFCFR